MRKCLSIHDGRPRPGHYLARPTAFESDLCFEALEDRRMLTAVPESLGEINPGGASNPAEFVNAGGMVFFSGDNGTNGPELWMTDGTIPGTLMVKDIRPLAAGSSPSYLTAVGGTLFFAADDGSNGVELWTSDGTSAGTTLVKNINLAGSSSPAELTNVNGTLYFRADNGANGAELWKSDGTDAGTVMVMDIHASAGSDPRYLIKIGGKLFFTADDGANGSELWMSDPGTSSTMMVKDINPGSYGSYAGYFRSMTNVGGILFFSALDSTNGFELWKSDGTMAGTTLVKDVRTGVASSFPFVMTDVGGTLFFTADDGATGFELWKSDGTELGTVPVKDINTGGAGSGPDALTNVGGTLLFRANDGTNGVELWKSDGSGAGTEIVLDINTSGSSTPRYLTNVSGTLYFRATEGTTAGLTGTELWSSDGTPGGTTLVADIAPAEPSSNPRGLANVTGTLFFSAESTANNQEPWIVRGPSASVAAARLFYNDSKFDGNNPAANAGDDAAIAIDKMAYMPDAGPATFANVSSYSKGINGVMFDLAGLYGTISAAALTVQKGTGNTPANWPLAPAPIDVVVRAGAGVGGSDRVELIWANEAINKTWLRVTVKANFNTNLAAPFTFLFGNAVGDSGMGNSPTAAITNAADEIFARNSVGPSQTVTSLADFNRDGIVNAADEIIARDNSGFLPLLNAVFSSVVGRHLFYNQSKFDGYDPAANSSDDAAIAPDKSAYLPGGGTATFGKITTYAHGINGIIIDISGSHPAISVADFTFNMGANNTPSTWAAAPAPTTVLVRSAAGVGGSDRVELIWANGAITNTWIEVIVAATTNTGLASPDVFFFGSRIGDTGTGSPTVAVTDASDEIDTRNNHGLGATITNLYDFDRTGVVAAADDIISRNNAGFTFKINITSPPAAPVAELQSSDGHRAAARDGLDAVGSFLAAASNSSGTFGAPRLSVDRLSPFDAGRPIAGAFHHAADDRGARARSMRAAIEQIAESLVLDDELLDELIAGLELG
ncbi:MAG: ELWxxDGT repeat protein [Pirellulales bacterium]